ncbi:MAG: hypothetical protein Q8L37_00015 [Candidatus Gottesmanbacteria bacterium]|nr:hypothetical protein [Candidatus Gottesmanbacteria bacterium]
MSSITSPVQIPLYKFSLPGGGFKIGIKASFDSKNFLMYEFDTGGSGFWAAGNDNWWPVSTYKPSPDSSPQTINYSSGIQYVGDPVVTEVYFENGLSVSTTVSRITEATKGIDNPSIVNAFNMAWANALTETSPENPPLWNNFFGDFGMSLAPFIDKTTGTEWFFGLLPQLLPPPAENSTPAMLNGYIINLNAASPYIQIGLAPSDIDNYTLYAMQVPPSPGTQPFPCSDIPSYCEQLLTGCLDLSLAQASFSGKEIGIVFDTGAPSAEIHTDADNAALSTISISALEPYLVNDIVYSGKNGKTQSSVKPNTGFALTSGSNTLLQFPVGSESGTNAVSATTLNLSSAGSGYVNAGLIPFFKGPVLYYFPFDGKGGYGNGQIGFPKQS